eukprot:scaffold191093_cov27-Tisochrysis_lutea.AAC.1
MQFYHMVHVQPGSFLTSHLYRGWNQCVILDSTDKGCRVPPGCCVALLLTRHEGQHLTHPTISKSK